MLTDADVLEFIGQLFLLYGVGFSAGVLHRTFIQLGDKL